MIIKSCWVMAIVLGLLGILCLQSAQAVPAFARREGVACQMCHFSPPELNADGAAFARQGFREVLTPAAPPTQPAAVPPVPPSLGEPLALQWTNYLSVMGIHGFTEGTGQKAAFDGGEVDLWIGGPLDTRWSALANVIFAVSGGGVDTEQAYAQYTSAQGAESFHSVRFGQLSPFAILLNGGNINLAVSTPVALSTSPDTGSTWTPTTLLRGIELGEVVQPRWNVYLGAAQPTLDGIDGTTQSIDMYASGEYLFGQHGNSLTLYGYWGKALL
ncbi:MAG TPA: hypothetical protein VGM23_07870, partial [Armatimonadota bacterium]